MALHVLCTVNISQCTISTVYATLVKQGPDQLWLGHLDVARPESSADHRHITKNTLTEGCLQSYIYISCYVV